MSSGRAYRPSPRLCSLLALCAAAVALAACAGADRVGSAPATLRITGSSSLTASLRELAGAFQGQHANIVIDLRGGGSGIGLGELEAGEADIAAVSWKADEQPVAAGQHATPIARDGIAIIVNPFNRVPGLTVLQARALYRGEILDWAALGGPQGEPLVISREDGSGTRMAFETLVMGNEHVTFDALVMPTSQSVVDYVASHRLAVGYVSIATLDERVRAVPIEEVAPTQANVRAGSYHLTRLLYLYAPSPAPDATRAFVDFVLSPAGQAIVSKRLVAVR